MFTRVSPKIFKRKRDHDKQLGVLEALPQEGQHRKLIPQVLRQLLPQVMVGTNPSISLKQPLKRVVQEVLADVVHQDKLPVLFQGLKVWELLGLGLVQVV